MARRTKEDAAKTRGRILKAALDLFSAKGYERTTIEDVAAHIKLSKGAVYWHFSSKPELLRQLVVYMVDEASGSQRVINSEPDNFEELRAGLKEWAGRVLDIPANRKFFVMMLQLDLSRSNLAVVVKQIKELTNGVIFVTGSSLLKMQARGDLRDGVDINVAKYAIGTAWIGMLKYALNIKDDGYDIYESLDFIMESVGVKILVNKYF